MKRCLTHFLAMILGVGFYAGGRSIHDFATAELQPPSERAQLILNSMESGNGWVVSLENDCLIHRDANLVVRPGLWRATVRLLSNPEASISLSFDDLRHINNMYGQAKTRLKETARLDRLQELKK